MTFPFDPLTFNFFISPSILLTSILNEIYIKNELYVNIDRDEAIKLKNSRKNKEIMVLKDNIGSATIIMNISNYEDDMLKHLLRNGSYIEINRDTNNKIIKEVTLAINNSYVDIYLKDKITLKNYVVP
jgi:hypothetical protein